MLRPGLWIGLVWSLLIAAPTLVLADEAHGDGVPGLVPEPDLVVWSLIVFGLFVFILGKFAWGPLRTALDQRETGIRKDLADAESNRLKSEALLREYEAKLAKAQEEVKEVLAEARRDAEYARQTLLADAQKEAEATRQRALADIDRARNVAMAELFDFVSKNVVDATEKVLQRGLKGEDEERLVGEALAELNLRRN
jgi:F-type H+-transporting ATPase subunit b